MTTQNGSVNNATMLNEIIDNAVELPLESQNLLLMMAKSMKYTRDSMIRQNRNEQSYNPLQEKSNINV